MIRSDLVGDIDRLVLKRQEADDVVQDFLLEMQGGFRCQGLGRMKGPLDRDQVVVLADHHHGEDQNGKEKQGADIKLAHG